LIYCTGNWNVIQNERSDLEETKETEWIEIFTAAIKEQNN
jgi:hypothetical protein